LIVGVGAGQREELDALDACVSERARDLEERRAGRAHVVDDQHCQPAEILTQLKARIDVARARDVPERGLRRRVANANDRVGPATNVERARDVGGEQRRLIEAALAEALLVDRHADDHVEPGGEPLTRDAREQPAERTGELGPPAVLEAPDRVGERPTIDERRVLSGGADRALEERAAGAAEARGFIRGEHRIAPGAPERRDQIEEPEERGREAHEAAYRDRVATVAHGAPACTRLPARMAVPTFHRLFVANRGEVAARITRACDLLGITPVLGFSEADRDAPYLRGRETVLLGPARAASSYLDMERVVQAAKQSRCSALHPGWGFLSESSTFAMLCHQHGITFVGPPAQAMSLMGKKTPAKSTARTAGLSLIPGSDGVLADADAALAAADATGYPVLFKAESGGGGRGMRIARSASEVKSAFDDARAEATAAFGDSRVFMEKLLEGGRHVEIQLMADRYGNAIHIGERDCTVQRNHQKLIEESPSPVLSDAERARAFEGAVRLTKNIGYVGAGTMEFLLDHGGTLRFMEMNTRLQVEHPVSEMRSGLDLMAEMIRVSAGRPLSVAQADVTLRGHAIECRINAEDPSEGFRPSPGTITRFTAPPPEDGKVRVDTHVEDGYVVPPFYDSLICKLIVHADTRDLAIDRMLRALAAMKVEGVKTTIPMHQKVLASEAFRTNRYDTRAIPGWS
jgi:acetyl-CoA carboxylase biotin carboxylase subunit